MVHAKDFALQQWKQGAAKKAECNSMDKETSISQASACTCQRASQAKDKETQKRKALLQRSMSNIPVLPSLPVLPSWIILILITSVYVYAHEPLVLCRFRLFPLQIRFPSFSINAHRTATLLSLKTYLRHPRGLEADIMDGLET